MKKIIRKILRESTDKENITQTQLYTLIDKIDAFKEHTNHTDWYLNGGCYVFADAMLKLLPNSELIGIGDDYSDIAHVVVLWGGYYVDYNNVTYHKSDILLNLDMDAHGPIRWTKPTTYTIRSQHNYSKSEVDQIISFFNPKDKPLKESVDSDWDFMDDVKMIEKNNSYETKIYFHPLPNPQDWDLIYGILTDDGYDWPSNVRIINNINPFSIWQRRASEEWEGYDTGFLTIQNKTNVLGHMLDSSGSISGHNYWVRKDSIDGNKLLRDLKSK